MTDRPDWIDDRLQQNVRNKLTQTHVVDTMLASERPFFSITQIEAELKPNVDRGTVRNRLTELQELDVVTEQAYPGVSLFHINHPESDWPLTPEGKRALNGETRLETLSAKDLITLKDDRAINTIVLSGIYLSGALMFVGALMSTANIPAPIETNHQVFTASIILFTFVFCILFLRSAIGAVRSLRSYTSVKFGGLF